MSTINDIIEATRTKFCPSIYHNYGGLNVLADELAELQDTSNIFALFVQSTNSTPIVEGRSISEEYTLSVAFCKLMPADSYDAEQVEKEYIAPCKDMAQLWLSWLIANYPRLRILATNANREYMRYDAILCGYSLTMQIKEYSVNYACLIKPTPVPQYQRILNKMPQDLRSALLVWYCPKLQGLTNAQLAENSGYYEGGLHDLSGNGYDADIYGMSGQIGDGYVNENGELVFDGVDDYIFTDNIPMFIIYAFYINAPIERNSFRLTASSNNVTVRYQYDTLTDVTLNLRWRNNQSNNSIPKGTTSKLFNLDTLYANSEIYELVAGNVDFTAAMRIQMGKASHTAFRQLIFRNFFAFSRALTDTEITWLQSNMINI